MDYTVRETRAWSAVRDNGEAGDYRPIVSMLLGVTALALPVTLGLLGLALDFGGDAGRWIAVTCFAGFACIVAGIVAGVLGARAARCASDRHERRLAIAGEVTGIIAAVIYSAIGIIAVVLLALMIGRGW